MRRAAMTIAIVLRTVIGTAEMPQPEAITCPVGVLMGWRGSAIVLPRGT
jgi:hypothetical protein